MDALKEFDEEGALAVLKQFNECNLTVSFCELWKNVLITSKAFYFIWLINGVFIFLSYERSYHL